MNPKMKIIISLGMLGLLLIICSVVMDTTPYSIPAMFSEANPPEGIQSTDAVKKIDVNSIELNLVNSDIAIQFGEQFSLSGTGNYCSYIKDGIFYAGADDTKYSIDVFGLKISLPAKWVCGYGSYILTVPSKTALESINISTFHCDIAADTLQAANININMIAGDLTINHITSDNLSVTIKGGKASIANPVIAASGNVEATGGIAIGGTTPEDSQMNSVSLSSLWGDISLASQVTGSFQIETSLGNITATLPGSSENYGLTALKGDLAVSSTAGKKTSKKHFADLSFICRHGSASVNFQ